MYRDMYAYIYIYLFIYKCSKVPILLRFHHFAWIYFMYIYISSRETVAGHLNVHIYIYIQGPKLNGHGDTGQRKVWFSGGFMHCTCRLTSLINVCPWVWCPMTADTSRKLHMCFIQGRLRSRCEWFRMRSQPCYVSAFQSCVMYSRWNPKDNNDMCASFFL
jgi:hypothetical protein